MKRALAMAIVFCMSINSFAAIVSDNDGSAFITKAEFDSLKNTFQSQIDNYNSSIDSKIDGAIAAYLAGIKTSKTEDKDILNKWSDVVFMNGVVAPEFNFYPKTNMTWAYGFYRNKGMHTTSEALICLTWNGGKWTYSPSYSTTYNRRPLVKCKTGSESSYGQFVWDGVAKQYKEEYTIGMIKFADPGTGLDGIDSQNWSSKKLTISNILKLNLSGYDTDLSDNISPTGQWSAYYSSQGTVTRNEVSAIAKYVTATTIPSLGTISDDDREKDHVIEYDGTKSWCVSNVDFQHTYRTHASQTLNSKGLYDACTKNQTGKGGGAWKGSGTSFDMAAVSFDDISTGYSESTSYKIASVGMLTSDKASNTIYQTKDDQETKVGTKKITVSPVTLEKGLALQAFPEDAECKWEITFGTVTAYEGSTNKTNYHEVDVYLSYVPFSDKTTSTDYVVLKGVPETQKYMTSKNRKVTIKWTNKKEKVIYVKCVPHWTSTSQISKDWSIMVDLSKDNGKVAVTTE